MSDVRRSTLSAICVVAFGSAASAADLPTMKGPPPAPTPPPIYSWTGFYGGLNAGFGWDGNDSAFSGNAPLAAFFAAGEFPTSVGTSSSGGLVGGQVGYNAQIAPSWVVGVETDLDWADVRGSGTVTPPSTFYAPFTTSASKSLDWLGTARVRGGFLPAPNVLVYATGGLAYGGVKESYSTVATGLTYATCPANFTCSIGSDSSTRLGWALGAGVEMALDAHWSVKAEYLFADLGKQSATALTTATGLPTAAFTASSNFEDSIARVGLNYKF